MSLERHVLVIFPHPDDETFSSAATLAKYVDSGVPVTYACLTLGQMGRNLGNPPFATRESLAKIREKELEDAMDVIGITDLRKMGLRDKTVEFEPKEEIDAMVQQLIDDVNPSLVISFYPGHAVHPDHEATAEAVVRTIGRMEASQRPKVQLVAFSHDAYDVLGEPDVVNDIRDYKERKIRAFEAHRSQSEPVLKQLDEASTEGTRGFFEYETYWTYNFE
ncbi:bacillithiol biosynthesis deacetylase BshB2 [Staphylococcus massiliensis]|uniref:Bacillithiol biosynthesis deacetylase BshB2 n=1 Tax=Staphylococcus massiliensis S46 TaxID=1229783 RepID=K9B0Y9_9STAP|nr:bacillithiol biosynthesis deacetylase BshB2 [Staphylococcus massiliensis]EKU47440.1 hypothetical protein C273_07697 [Staphylococcus massiliensis S46]MCG3400356.1 bacillithiol biosynthesis deacetylase BshB2 [Staphylococcus massiliensis]MCG3412386.1 bacillithiol biosynthesis deacetylase BshB2 [Staphylococcus massiliensis]POA00915.1 bacillithiol biosynthesis deacetylase BshB2 [Staphylococcus massiliensis CCUG 55927]